MKCTFAFLVFLLNFCSLVKYVYTKDGILEVHEVIEQTGYPAEKHQIRTEDNYLLTVHRIPHSKYKTKEDVLQPVILQHSFLESSADFIIRGEKHSLGFILSNAGYDVWMPNSRGNVYSREHVHLSADDKEFWEFSWDEMAKYDLPAVINYIIESTGQSGNIIYVGHSMGTTIFFALLSEEPEYCEKIRAMVALAPVTGLKYIQHPLKYLAQFVKYLQWIFDNFGIYEISRNSTLLKTVTEIRLSKVYATHLLSSEPDEELITKILEYVPAGTSMQTLIHYAQEINANGSFQHFDYGERGNLIRYGTKEPLQYDIKKIAVPTAVFYGTNDKISVKKAAEEIYSKLQKQIKIEEIPFNHIEFLWSKIASELLYKRIVKVMKNFT